MSEVTYWEYLDMASLLGCQEGKTPNDLPMIEGEVDFIITHQIFELGYKQLILALGEATELLNGGNTVGASRKVAECSSMLTALTQNWAAMSKLTPARFLRYRDKLFPASGVQSYQFPVIENLVGLEEQLLVYGETRSLPQIERAASTRSEFHYVLEALGESRRAKTLRSALTVTLPKSVYKWFRAHGLDTQVFLNCYETATRKYFDNQIEMLSRSTHADVKEVDTKFARRMDKAREFFAASEISPESRTDALDFRAALLLIQSNPEAFPLEHELIEHIVDLEFAILHWRFQHARVAERLIGYKVGTGGTEGVAYLESSMGLRIFADIFESRSVLIPHELLETAISSTRDDRPNSAVEAG